MAGPSSESDPPYLASPGRRLFHALIALAGWVLFGWWWWLVFRRVSEHEIRFTLLFLGIALVLIVGLTILWAVHNAWIFRRKGPRQRVHPVEPDFTHDRVGRSVELPLGVEKFREARLVRVRIVEGVKVYDSSPVATVPAGKGPR